MWLWNEQTHKHGTGKKAKRSGIPSVFNTAIVILHENWKIGIDFKAVTAAVHITNINHIALTFSSTLITLYNAM